jgi:hypothetical protein
MPSAALIAGNCSRAKGVTVGSSPHAVNEPLEVLHAASRREILMMTNTHQRMHQDHLDWRSNNAFWSEEVRTWRNELEDAKGGVARLRSDLEAMECCIECHAAANLTYEHQMLNHERSLAAYERGALDQRPLAANAMHAEEAVRHCQQQNMHDRIKTHHHNVMKRWRALLKALKEPL